MEYNIMGQKRNCLGGECLIGRLDSTDRMKFRIYIKIRPTNYLAELSFCYVRKFIN